MREFALCMVIMAFVITACSTEDAVHKTNKEFIYFIDPNTDVCYSGIDINTSWQTITAVDCSEKVMKQIELQQEIFKRSR